ncbi:hypothetical protein F5X96DRAFT_319383 [Biscogniauxia mediterranea]|nr:hypothetical protein F5X96DRAFT_319383 [Biscogniauxia mediterranea]
MTSSFLRHDFSMTLPLLVLLLSLLSSGVRANTEKAIFLGPPAVDIPPDQFISSRSSSGSIDNNILDNLRVHVLTPDHHALRTHLEAQFPGNSLHHGKPTWLILDELTEGQRYEVRVCWAATQPTAFRVNTFELQTILETPELLSELSDFSSAQRQLNGKAHDEIIQEPGSAKPSGAALRSGRKASLLFLQILAAADYYTMNSTLMQHVPPVHVDIILDPFIFNLLPRSLVPTVAYIIAVALVSWFTAQRISTWIRHVAVEPIREKKDQ